MHPLRLQKLLVLEPGIEPGTYCVLGSRHNQLDHSSTNFSILGGTRTPNLEIRSLTPYPVRPRGHPDAACTACRGSITLGAWGSIPRGSITPVLPPHG